jgi:hypothetical protein
VLPTIQERFVTAWDVVVAHNGEASGEGDRNDERSTPPSTTPVRPGPQDTERINRLAREFERAATQSRSFWEKPHREVAYQQREVREFILHSAQHAQPESREAAQATETAAADAAPEGIRAQVNIAEVAARETGPRTELGRMFRDHVLKQAARNPKRWARWQARMASGGEFLRYSGLNNAGEAILGEAWGQAMGAAGNLPYVAKELMKKVPKAVLEKAYQQKVAAMEGALDGSFSFGEAFARVSEAAWRDPVMPWRSAEQMREWTASVPSEEAVLENLAKRPPYMRARQVAENSYAAAEAAAEKLAGTLSKWSGSTRHRSIGETLVVYDDWLMPQSDRAPATLRTAFLKKSPAPLTLEEVSSSYSTARSFQALRGFSRVGGIMIGRDAPSKARGSFADLRWTQEGTGLRLLLVRRDGSAIRSRAFDPQVVRAALAYAGTAPHPAAPRGGSDGAGYGLDRGRRLDFSQKRPHADERCDGTSGAGYHNLWHCVASPPHPANQAGTPARV